MLDLEMLSCGQDLHDSIPEKPGLFPSGRHDRYRPGMATQEDIERLTNEQQHYRALWAAVLIQAVKDFLKIGPSNENNQYRTHGFNVRSEASKRWFLSDSHLPGSFRWVCDYLALDDEAIIRALGLMDREAFRGKQRINYVLNMKNGRGQSRRHQLRGE